MQITEILLSQFTDPFRIGLLIALVLTAFNTAAAVGIAIPVALGVVFVAVLIPVTSGGTTDPNTLTEIMSGLFVNAVLVGALLAIRTVWKRVSAAGSN